MIDYDQFKQIVNHCGGSRPFNSARNADNFFVYLDHNIGLYNFATVNDRCQAPERLYMDPQVALDVRNLLNALILKQKAVEATCEKKESCKYYFGKTCLHCEDLSLFEEKPNEICK